MKKHSSNKSPPEYRYFTSNVFGGMSSTSQASPGKRIHQRSECIDQLHCSIVTLSKPDLTISFE